jgi:hypothetical protein
LAGAACEDLDWSVLELPEGESAGAGLVWAAPAAANNEIVRKVQKTRLVLDLNMVEIISIGSSRRPRCLENSSLLDAAVAAPAFPILTRYWLEREKHWGLRTASSKSKVQGLRAAECQVW